MRSNSIFSKHELGCGRMEGWPSRKGLTKDPGDGKSTGQVKEGKATEAVSDGFPRSHFTETEAKGQLQSRFLHRVWHL